MTRALSFFSIRREMTYPDAWILIDNETRGTDGLLGKSEGRESKDVFENLTSTVHDECTVGVALSRYLQVFCDRWLYLMVAHVKSVVSDGDSTWRRPDYSGLWYLLRLDRFSPIVTPNASHPWIRDFLTSFPPIKPTVQCSLVTYARFSYLPVFQTLSCPPLRHF